MSKDLVDRLIDEDDVKRDQMAMQVFGKHEVSLSLMERDELDDWINPQWKGVIENDGNKLIEVSNVGTCRFIGDEQLMKITYPKTGLYPFVSYYEYRTRGKQYMHSIHKLVADLFVPNPDNKPEVNHIDGVKTHNWYKNLEWVTRKENEEHAYRTGLAPAGEDSGMAIYTNEQIHQVCDLLQFRPELSFREIESATGVHEASVCKVYNRSEWNEISKGYNFPPRESNKGEGHWNSSYTDDQVKQACNLLSDPKYSSYTFQQIGSVVGMDDQTVGDIYRKSTRSDITKNFIFVPRATRNKGESNTNSKYTDEQVEQVCQLLDSNMDGSNLTQQKIAELTGTCRAYVSDILNGRIRTDISRNHPFYKTNSKGGTVYAN